MPKATDPSTAEPSAEPREPSAEPRVPSAEPQRDNIFKQFWNYISRCKLDGDKTYYFDPEKIKKFSLLINIIMGCVILVTCVYMINSNSEYYSDKEYLTREELNDNEKKLSNASLIEQYNNRINNIKINAGKRFETLFKQLAICSLIYFFICKVLLGAILSGASDQLFAILIMFILGGTGKMIEGYGLRDCLKIPGIKTNNPSQILIFDMFFTNTFAYLMDFVFAFAVAIIGFNCIDDRREMMKENLELSSKNVGRYFAYLFTVLSFVLLSGIIRPKVGLALYRIIGVPIIDATELKRKDINGSLLLPTDVSNYIQGIRAEDKKKGKNSIYDDNTPDKKILEDNPVLSMMGDTSVSYSEAGMGLLYNITFGLVGKKMDDPLVYYNTAYKGMGIVMAGVVELIVFICILFPVRKFLLYNLKTTKQDFNNGDYNDGYIGLIIKNVIVFVVLATLFFVGRHLTYGRWDYVEREDNDQKIIIPKSNSQSISCNFDVPFTSISLDFNYVLIIISLVLLFVTSLYILRGNYTNVSLYIGILMPFIISYGIVVLITNFLIPKEKESDNKESDSKDWTKYMNIFNPERDGSGRGSSFGISFAFALGMTLMMWYFSGRGRIYKPRFDWPWPYVENYDGLTKYNPKQPFSEPTLAGEDPLRTTQGFPEVVPTDIQRTGGKPRKGKKSSAKKSKVKAKGKKK